MRLPKTLMVIFLTLIAGPVSAQKLPSATQQFAEGFYQTCQKLKIRGLPGEMQMQALKPYLTSDLVALMEAARRKQTQYIQTHPGEKPPWIEGDLFSSLFEGFTSFKVGTPTGKGDSVEVPVKLQYLENNQKVQWKDILVVIREGGEWRVWDIEFKGKWKFKSGGSLREILTASPS